jgi:hypothetical protein
MDWSVYRTPETKRNSSDPNNSSRNQPNDATTGLLDQYLAIRVHVIITGSVGEINFMNMLVEATSSLFLLGVAEFIMIYIVLKFFPNKELYARAVYQKTKSFNPDALDDIKQRRSSLWECDDEPHLQEIQKELSKSHSHNENLNDSNETVSIEIVESEGTSALKTL